MLLPVYVCTTLIYLCSHRVKLVSDDCPYFYLQWGSCQCECVSHGWVYCSRVLLCNHASVNDVCTCLQYQYLFFECILCISWCPTCHHPSSSTRTLQCPNASTGRICTCHGTIMAWPFSVQICPLIRHPVLEWGTQCQHWVPLLSTVPNGNKFAQFRHWVKKVPPLELGRWWNGG